MWVPVQERDWYTYTYHFNKFLLLFILIHILLITTTLLHRNCTTREVKGSEMFNKFRKSLKVLYLGTKKYQ